MGSKLSKFLFGTEVDQLSGYTPCSSPQHPFLYTANQIIIHRPEVPSDSDDELYPYEFPVFLSSPYDEKNIITISDSE